MNANTNNVNVDAYSNNKKAGYTDSSEAAEEQGWLARMVHLLHNDDESVHFEVSGQSFDRIGWVV